MSDKEIIVCGYCGKKVASYDDLTPVKKGAGVIIGWLCTDCEKAEGEEWGEVFDKLNRSK